MPASTTARRKSEADRPIREAVGLLSDEDALDAAVGDLLVKDFERRDRRDRRGGGRRRHPRRADRLGLARWLDRRCRTRIQEQLRHGGLLL